MPDLAQRLRSLHTALGSGNWSRGRIRAFQSRRIRELVRHAYERVPFYREIFHHHGVHPDDIRGLEDLDKLPIVERADIQ
ncbi:MAG: phenylacetate--CoA ligase, partial [bacterium]|nr:phenylacetate--CoA ligase [bacterium]